MPDYYRQSPNLYVANLSTKEGESFQIPKVLSQSPDIFDIIPFIYNSKTYLFVSSKKESNSNKEMIYNVYEISDTASTMTSATLVKSQTVKTDQIYLEHSFPVFTKSNNLCVARNVKHFYCIEITSTVENLDFVAETRLISVYINTSDSNRVGNLFLTKKSELIVALSFLGRHALVDITKNTGESAIRLYGGKNRTFDGYERNNRLLFFHVYLKGFNSWRSDGRLDTIYSNCYRGYRSWKIC